MGSVFGAVNVVLGYCVVGTMLGCFAVHVV